MPVYPRSPKSAPKGKASLVSNAIKYGPLIYEGVRRYGPVVREQVVTNKDVLADVLPKSGARKGEARKNALAHAGSVVEGSAMQCFHQAKEYWVVFSGETPIGVHPFTNVPYAELLRHADLGKRVRPDERAARGVLGKVAGAVLKQPTKGTRPAPQTYDPARGTTSPTAGNAQRYREEPVEGEIV